MITRRSILQALPFLGASAALPSIAVAAPAMSVREQIDQHIAALSALITATAGPCDGWRVHIGSHPWDRPAPIVRAERYWRTSELLRGGSDRCIDVDRMREFDPRTGEHTDYQPPFDINLWKPRSLGDG